MRNDIDPAIRHAIREVIGDQIPTWQEVVDAVSERFPDRDPEELSEAINHAAEFSPEIIDHTTGLYVAPQLFNGVSFALAVDAQQADADHLAIPDHLMFLGYWIDDGVPLIDGTDGRTLGQIRFVEAVDVDPDASIDEYWLVGPTAWLHTTTEPSTICLGVADSSIVLQRVASVPSLSPDATALIRECVENPDETGDEDALVDCDDLLATCVARSPELFRGNILPDLDDVVTQAGLSRHGRSVARGDFDWTTWEIDRHRSLLGSIHGLRPDDTERLLDVLHLARRANQNLDEVLGQNSRDLARVIAAMFDDETFAIIALHEILLEATRVDRDAGRTSTRHLLDRVAELTAPTKHDGLQWARSVATDLCGDATSSSTLLDPIAESTTFRPATIAAACFASDRGERDRAVALLGRLAISDVPLVDETSNARWLIANQDDLETEVHILSAPARSKRSGRNEPCPCGSGRKYKHCHLGKPAEALGERAYWLHSKLVRYVNLHHQDEIRALAEKLSGRDPWLSTMMLNQSNLSGLTAAGCQAAFVKRRGALLPVDELELARSWIAAPLRSVEVERAGADRVELRDVSTGETICIDHVHPSVRPKVGLTGSARPLPFPDGTTRLPDGIVLSRHLIRERLRAQWE